MSRPSQDRAGRRNNNSRRFIEFFTATIRTKTVWLGFGSGCHKSGQNGTNLGKARSRKSLILFAFLCSEWLAFAVAASPGSIPGRGNSSFKIKYLRHFRLLLGQIWAKLAAKSRKIGSNRAKNSSISSRSLVGVCTQVPYVS